MIEFRRPTAIVVTAVVIAMTGYGTVAAPAANASTAVAADTITIPAGGTGVGTPQSVDVKNLPATPATATPGQLRTFGALDRNGQLTGSALPSRHNGGQRPVPPAPQPAGKTANAATAGQVTPQVAPGINANFDAQTLAQSACGCQPPDVNAAVGTTRIVEAVNLRVNVYTKTGASVCGFQLATFLGTADSLTDPRVQYDNVNARFSLVVTLRPASGTATPALWVAATQTSDPCGVWNRFRVGFSGGFFPAGTFLDYPQLGQDRNALLLSTNNFHPNLINSTAFAIPKSAVYSGAGFSFSAFSVAFTSEPVSNGGIPMMASTFSYYLASVPGVGYNLYRMANSAGPGTTLVLQATISAPFNPPSRRANQPGTAATLDSFNGSIQWSPVLASGGFIWFAHGIDFGGFPTVRYGSINTNNNTTGGIAMAFHSNTSDDFNPSVGVGNNPGGGAFIYVNWAYTDTAANVAASDTVDMVLPGGGVPNLIATGAVLVNGSSTNEDRFGDYSSVSIDPAVSSGSCAVTAQQYFGADTLWRTRIARVGTC